MASPHNIMVTFPLHKQMDRRWNRCETASAGVVPSGSGRVLGCVPYRIGPRTIIFFFCLAKTSLFRRFHAHTHESIVHGYINNSYVRVGA